MAETAGAADTGATEENVRKYYDNNTRVFGFFDGKKASFAIHRRVWAPGVKTVYESTDYVHHALAQELESSGAAVDLGCGVGESLGRLAQIFQGSKTFAGITISPEQAALARSYLPSGIAVVTGSYLDAAAIPEIAGGTPGSPKPTLFYAIESLNHSPSASAFVDVLSLRAKSGDRFAVCDDFLGAGLSGAGSAAGSRRNIRSFLHDAFRIGWLSPDLQSPDGLQDLFSKAGWKLTRNEDWSPWVNRSGWLRVLVSRVLVNLRGKSALGRALKGGAALILGYRLRCFEYRFMVWEKG